MYSNAAVYRVIAATQEGFDGIEVEYVTMPGWQQPILRPSARTRCRPTISV